MIKFPRLVSACVRTLPTSPRLFSVSSSAQFRRPLDLEEEHIESVSLREESRRSPGGVADSQFPPTAEYDGAKAGLDTRILAITAPSMYILTQNP